MSLMNEWVPVTCYVSFIDTTHEITDFIIGYYRALRPCKYNGGVPTTEKNIYWKKI